MRLTHPWHPKAKCSRSWETEAARDGRLSGVEAESLAAHLKQCGACRAHSEYIRGLARRLGDLAAPQADEVAFKRLRHAILAQADAALTGQSVFPLNVRTRWTIAMFAFVALMIGLLTLDWRREPDRTSASRQPLTTVDIVGEEGARWTRRTEVGIERIELMDGTLHLRVRRSALGRRVVVRVPDGEIEDAGTVFYVVVRQGRTQRIGVEEGRVTVRPTNAAPFSISSSETWERPVASEPTTRSAPLAFDTPAPISNSLRATRQRELSHHSNRPVAPRPHRLDATQEDAAYLRILQLVREGRKNEANIAAHDYLSRFPNGFRREEVGHIAE